MQKFKQNTEKLEELILYISEKLATDSHYGATKLNKVLFLSDFMAYAKFGKPITGVEYIRRQFGPVPKPLVPVRDQMIKKGKLAIQETTIDPTISQKRPVNLKAAELKEFSAEEIALVDSIIDTCKDSTGKHLSNYTHQWHGWIAAEDGETIPYETVFISERPITPFEIERGRELAAKYGWHV
jgi:hypothetical protein